MSAKDLREKSKADLQGELLKEREALFNLRMQKGSGQLARPDLMKKTRRNIARIKTVMTQQAEGDQ